MNFAEIMYQSALFTATFFIFNKLFSRYVFKNRQEVPFSLGKIVSMFVMYVILGTAINYFVEKYKAPAQEQVSCQVPALASGQSMIAPVKSLDVADLQVPLKTQIDVAQNACQAELTTVTTDLAQYVFSNQGATLQSITLFWQNDKPVKLLAEGSQHFMLAFDGSSPNNYQLIRSEKINACIHEVVYQASYDHGTIEKKFVLDQKTYQIDVQVRLAGLREPTQVRLFVPTPEMSEQLHGVVNGAISGDRVKLQDISLDKANNLQQFWFEPKIFGFSTHYFTNVCFAHAPISLGRAYLKENADRSYQAILESKLCDKNAELSWSFYFGPNATQDLQAVSPALSNLVDYGWFGFLAKPMAQLLVLIKQHTGSYGWAIILIAILIKLIMLPFMLRGERGMKEQAEFEKKRQHLQQKFKHDKAALDKATSELIQKHGLPIFSGCLPMLLNIPVFLALNKVLTSSTELYGAPFLWLPDLSAADPYYILGILTFIGMIFAPSIQTGPRQIFSKIGFALFLGAVTTYLASGLALFVVINTLFGFVQTWIVNGVRLMFAR